MNHTCIFRLLSKGALGIFAISGTGASAATETVLHSFQPHSDGCEAWDSPILDKNGNLYGTAAGCGPSDDGTVFKLAPDGTYTLLHIFSGGVDGVGPKGGLIRDGKGNLYGTTDSGGTGANSGIVFKLARNGTETVLDTFDYIKNDGASSIASLVRDKSGNLYGTTQGGGNAAQGTVFKVAPDGSETVLYRFQGRSDGGYPYAGLIQDKGGNLYGTTYQGGIGNGYGVVFKLAPDGTETVLHSFAGGMDGSNPEGGLIADTAGNLYGTTSHGGANNGGTIFKLARDGTETVLHSFSGSPDGEYPYAGLIRDDSGNFYGTTVGGGAFSRGTVFELASDGTETVLYSFNVLPDGSNPYGGLVRDNSGNLYGTTYGGGANNFNSGTIFKIAP